MMAPLLDLSQPNSWPKELRRVIDDLRPVFLAWEQDHLEKSASTFDGAMKQLGDALRPFAIRGFHFTRLTENEAADIRTGGLKVLSPALVARRVAAQVAHGSLTSEQAAQLLKTNQVRDANRGGRIWFCFYPPAEAVKSGVKPLLEHWGGEALYNINAKDPVLGPLLRSIGRPALVQAQVPTTYLHNIFGLATAAYQADLADQGYELEDTPGRFEDYSRLDLEPPQIEHVFLHPDADFIQLTGSSRSS
ncbi:hypothetical protein JH308_07650 [Xanthomonas campestris pv. campestris]|nr:hypothetical protein JH308_07650 [Xanthomonas campestris pv. campestris]WDK52606.1 hypothetical protein JH267_13500 [Xanthomonas campestris pv. campestris]WDL61431.1 hypothetical protein JH259_13435 [Xanthomonas campestris pv. campestris]